MLKKSIKSIKSILLAIFYTVLAAMPANAKAVEKLPVEVFAKLPTISHFKLSPDGTQFAYITPSKGRKNLVIQALDGSKAVSLPPIGEAEIFRFWWATNERLLIGLKMASTKRGVGITTTETRLLAIDATLKNSAWIVKPSTIKKLGGRNSKIKLPPPQIQTNIIDLLPDDPDHILLSANGRLDNKNQVRKINILTGDYDELRSGSRGIQNWYTNHQGQLSFGNGYDKSTWYASLRMPDGKWRDITDLKAFDSFDFENFTEDNNIIYVSGHSEFGTTGLYKMDLTSGEIIEPVFEHEKVDIDSTVHHPRTGQVIGVAYTVDRRLYHYFDPEFAKIQRIVQKSLKNPNVSIVEKVKGKAQYVVFASNDTDPGVYYWYDHNKKALSFISPTRPDIDPEQMASVKPVSIPMRDGTYIPGYLTLPKGKAAKDLATVILPHGGPPARDSASWDFIAQFLANRGYAVLQPNFRGSDGYGYQFQKKGEKQWGGLMQRDVTDATKWLIDEGIAAGDKVCIAGASYGGYAALMGVIQESGLYKCAVSINGVTNMQSMKINDKKFLGGRAWTKNMGLEGSKDKDVSPYHQAQRVSAPVLVMSSKDDTRLDFDWSQDFHKRLKKLKKDSTYVLIEDGGHSMVTEKSRLTMLQNMEKFLAKHIGN